MKKWNHKINFSSFWDKDIPIDEKGKLASNEIYKLKDYFEDDWDFDEVVEAFNSITGDGEPPETTEFTLEEDFDARMFELYEWADANNVWVEVL